jgi:hypothetical protein
MGYTSLRTEVVARHQREIDFLKDLSVADGLGLVVTGGESRKCDVAIGLGVPEDVSSGHEEVWREAESGSMENSVVEIEDAVFPISSTGQHGQVHCVRVHVRVAQEFYFFKSSIGASVR